MRHCNDVSAWDCVKNHRNDYFPSLGICVLMVSSGLGKRDAEVQFWISLPLFFLSLFFFNFVLNLSFHLE